MGVFGIAFEAGKALLLHHDTVALLLVMDDVSILKTGLPVDYYDILAVLDSDTTIKKDCHELSSVLQLVSPHCKGDILCISHQITSNLIYHNLKAKSMPNMNAMVSYISNVIKMRLS